MKLSKICSVILTIHKRREQSNKLLEQCLDCGIHNTVQFFAFNPYTDKDTFKIDYIDGTDLPPHYTNSINYPTWFNRPNAYNAWKCHHQIMMDFAKKRYPADTNYLLMLEDDAFIYEDEFKSQLALLEESLQQGANIPMLYFGWYSNGNFDMHDTIGANGKTLAYRFSGGAGFHGVLLRRDTVQFLLDFLPIGSLS